MQVITEKKNYSMSLTKEETQSIFKSLIQGNKYNKVK